MTRAAVFRHPHDWLTELAQTGGLGALPHAV